MNRNTRVIVQGITGREGSFHTKLMLDYGTRIVAGVTPGKGGTYVHGVPVYDTVEDALREHEAEASIVFVPAQRAPDAVYEAVDAGIKLVVVITEHIPIVDSARMIKYAKARGVRVVGPNSPGIIVPEETLIGIMPVRSFRKGRVGIASRSGTLTYEVAEAVKELGHSTVIGVGGDPIVGTPLDEAALMFENDPETEAIVIIGEIGGTSEERIAEYVLSGKIKKPVVAYIAGRTAPKERRMGHAGAVVYMGQGTFESKMNSFRRANVPVAETPYQVAELLRQLL
ncbi:MAG: succinate--CoA ligase subunit alpha [Sulfolobaceae archaeon]|nr:succinate--CoA ligase subunit alpha [Sulfolobales archaeon]MCQ4407398.1 succinate--CoA ligase subunit alpha [Sulfolobales archaeon]MCQ4448017.1 succinate--CoA ligase subunit alpha [Sulfolobales archaeon]MCQ4450112.1 succinate--CoA ligase subunit alpha [Sulfolobales archaeon]MDT7899350.1 succinate--CoA ligase subunit alpha [Sulfolobales archaeon]